MSAFLCSPDDLNALVTYWEHMTNAPSSFTGKVLGGIYPGDAIARAIAASWRDRNPHGICDPTRRDHAAIDIVSKSKTARSACFRILLQANLDSLSARYPQDGSDTYESVGAEYSVKRLPIVMEWIMKRQTGHLVGLCKGYEYQACEHDGWSTSVAFHLVQQIKTMLLDDLQMRDCGDKGLWAGWTAPKAPAAQWAVSLSKLVRGNRCHD